MEVGHPLATAHRTGKSPAFQFYPKDFLSSTKVQRMSLTEVGAYTMLLAYCWLDGSITADVRELARILKVPPKQFERMWAGPLSECFTAKGGRLVNERLEDERRAQAKFRAKMSENGKKGGRPKATGSSGLSQSKANESSAISDLQSASASAMKNGGAASPPPTPRGAPIHPKRNLKAAFEGARGLHVPESLHQQFVALRNHHEAEREIRAFYVRVCDDWSIGARKHDSPNVDMFVFWRERYAEAWPPTPAQKVDDKTPDWLRKAREHKRAGAA